MLGVTLTHQDLSPGKTFSIHTVAFSGLYKSSRGEVRARQSRSTELMSQRLSIFMIVFFSLDYDL